MKFSAATQHLYTRPRGRKPKLEPFTREEFRTILCQYHRNSPSTIRDKAIVVFLYRGSARIGATLRMMPDDIDWNRNIVRIYKDKGGKTRTIALDERAMKYLRKWNEARTKLGLGNDAPFFCTCKTPAGHVDPSWVLHIFKQRCREAGITRPVTLHLLRHTGASELLEEGFDIATISRVLGHSSIQTTYRYLHELRPDIMNSKLAEREW
jgi:integrase/recombinase XerD